MTKLETVAGCALFIVSRALFIPGSAGFAQAATPARHNMQQDRQFLRAVAIEDMTQAHMAEMAQSSASQGAVKDLGGAVAQEDRDEYGQLSMLAGKAGAEIPKGINATRNPSIQALTRRKGADFDRGFLRTDIADERKMISLLETEAAHGTNADIKAWAQKTLATRKQELDKARSLAK
jgi:putative membrane protein